MKQHQGLRPQMPGNSATCPTSRHLSHNPRTCALGKPEELQNSHACGALNRNELTTIPSIHAHSSRKLPRKKSGIRLEKMDSVCGVYNNITSDPVQTVCQKTPDAGFVASRIITPWGVDGPQHQHHNPKIDNCALGAGAITTPRSEQFYRTVAKINHIVERVQ